MRQRIQSLRTGALQALAGSALIFAEACRDPIEPPRLAITAISGLGLSDTVDHTLAPFVVRVSDGSNPVAGVTVHWSVASGGGSIAPGSSATDASGLASATLTLGPTPGSQTARAELSGAIGSPVIFTVTAVTGRQLAVLIIAGSDQTDTVGASLAPFVVRVLDGTVPARGIAVHWRVDTGGGSVSPAVSTTDTGGIAQAVLTLDTVRGPHVVSAYVLGGAPVTFQALARAGSPAQLTKIAGDAQSGPVNAYLPFFYVVMVRDRRANRVPAATVHWTVTAGGGSVGATSETDDLGIARMGHRLGPAPGLNTVTASVADTAVQSVSFTATGIPPVPLVAAVPIPPNYGIHDTFVRDGLAFVSAWNSGLMIFDVGNGMRGGSPAAPALVSSLVTSDNGVPGGPAVHNAWWFHNPSTGERRYVFIGQEGPFNYTARTASGNIHVVDIADLANPVEVAYFHITGAGPHNFWMDESAEILYSAYYNAGVVALDVSGTLAGNLAGREIARIQPGGSGSTSTWGVQLSGGSLYAIDELSGLWQLQLSGSAFTVRGGGFNLPQGVSTDFWVHAGHAYTGQQHACAGECPPGVTLPSLYVWRLGAGGAPTLVDSIMVGSSGGLDHVTDVEVSDDGKVLMFSDEGGTGLHFYDLADPGRPIFIAQAVVTTGVHTATFGVIGGRRYVFAAKDPPDPALLIYDVTDLRR